MKEKNSGNVYAINLDFDFGSVYAGLLDYTDVRDFDGILVKVYRSVREIKEKEVFALDDFLFGPVPINKYPNTKGKYAWKLLGKCYSCIINPNDLWFKNLRGIINKDNDWSNLEPWFKSKPFTENYNEYKADYADIRELEILILHHLEMVKIKSTMLLIIEAGKNVDDFYDLKQIGNQNMYIQLVNTYFNKEKSRELLKVIPK